jgi:hypothetical protein
MKVLDMFGSGVCVCAAHFPALNELVKHDVNGKVFESKEELFQQMYSLLFAERYSNRKKDGADNAKNWLWEATELQKLRINAAKIGTWDENWDANMRPVIESVVKMKRSIVSLELVVFISAVGILTTVCSRLFGR